MDTSGTALPGAEFTLYSDADCTNAIKTVQETSVQGTFTISARDSDLARYFPSAGKEDVKIYMKETTVPAGCDPSNTVYTITLGTSKTSGWNERHTAFVTTTTYSIRYQGGTTARIVNQKSDSDVVHSELTIRKGSSVETSLLNGAEFDVFSDSECTNKLTDTPIVTANGEAYINTSAAYLSTYLPTESNPTVHVYVKETKAPTGYALPDPNTPYDLTITYSKTDNDVIHYDISTGDPASKTLAIQNKPITAKDTKDASLTIYKVDEDEQPLPGAEFSLYTDENCTDALTTQSTGIDGTLKISTDADYLDSVRPQLQQGQTTASNTIYLKETKAPTGFAESSAVYPITITASSTDAWNADHSAYVTTTSYTIANNGSDSITVTNKAITSLTVTKTWNGTTGNSAKVRLTINGTPDEQNPEHTVTLSAPNWSTTFSNLPKFDSNGEEIIYGVEELDAQNYAVSSVRNADGSITNTNSQSTEVTSLTVNKQWLDGASGTQAIFELVQNGEMTGRVIVLTERGGWTGKFGDLPKYDTAGNLYTYDAVEKTVGYDSEKTDPVRNDDGTFTVSAINRPSTEKTRLEVTKEWEDGASGEKATVELTANGEGTGKIKDLIESESWHAVFEDLPRYDNQGQEIQYSVVEKTNNYAITILTEQNDDGSFTTVVTNRPSTEEISIPVQKKWAQGVKGEEAVIVLTVNGKATDQKITLTENGSWKGSFDHLKKYDSNGQEIEYGVTEETSEWTYTVEKDNKGGFIVTNYPKTTEKNKPNTGDTAGILLWASMLLTAAVASLLLFFVRRKRKDQE